MDTKQLHEYRLKMLGDPDNGVEPTMSLADLDPASEDYKALRPYALGTEEWPEYEAPIEEPVVEEPETPVTPETPVIETEAPAVVEARDRVKLRETSREAFDTEVAAINAVLDEQEPADEFSDEYKDWQKRQTKALRDLTAANSKYIRARDVEDIESGRGIVEKSEVATTIKAIGVNYPELALPYSYEDGVNQYNQWAEKALAESGGTDLNAAYTKFKADPEFAAKVGPLPADHEKLFVFMHATAAAKNGGSLKGHILAIADDEGIFTKARAAAAVRDAQARTQAGRDADALHARGTEPRPPSVKGGQDSVEAPVVTPHARMTEEQAMSWLENYQKNILKKPMTATERVEYSRLRDIALSKLTQSEARSAY